MSFGKLRHVKTSQYISSFKNLDKKLKIIYRHSLTNFVFKWTPTTAYRKQVLSKHLIMYSCAVHIYIK